MLVHCAYCGGSSPHGSHCANCGAPLLVAARAGIPRTYAHLIPLSRSFVESFFDNGAVPAYVMGRLTDAGIEVPSSDLEAA
jgi:hypothetical protein